MNNEDLYHEANEVLLSSWIEDTETFINTMEQWKQGL